MLMALTSMDLELRHLRLVQAIAEEGGMTRAAHRLHLTQSALSHQLRAAEEQVGALLFTRFPRKMSLTPAGERLLRAARSVLTELDHAQREIRDAGKTPEAVLRIATQCYTVYHWLPARVRLFARKHPGVEVRVVAEASPHPFSALLESKLDLAIVSRPIRDRRIVYTPLFEDELVLIAAPDHPLSRRTVVALEELAGETLLIYPPREESTFLTRILLPAGVAPRCIQEIQLTEAIIELVKGGLGVAALARWAVAPHVAAGTLRALRLTREGYYRQWSAARLRRGPSAPHVDAFVELLQKHPIPRQLRRLSSGPQPAVSLDAASRVA